MAELAINGGTPLRTIPYPVWPVYDETEKQAILEVLESRQWGTLGPCVLAFEKEFAEYLGAARVQTVNSGTVSLEVILRALGIGPGDEVIIPPYTFIATATAVLMVGAMEEFLKVENISVIWIRKKQKEPLLPGPGPSCPSILPVFPRTWMHLRH